MTVAGDASGALPRTRVAPRAGALAAAQRWTGEALAVFVKDWRAELRTRHALHTLLPLATARRFHVALVHGVTGSGKTELYLRLAEAVRRTGRGVLVLVPEIALTPQVAAVFRARFGSGVAIQHSGLSDGERHDRMRSIRGDAVVRRQGRAHIWAGRAQRRRLPRPGGWAR